MIRTCKNCGGRITFDVQLKALACASCGSTFDVSEFDAEADGYDELEPTKLVVDDTIDCSVYQCSSCGAEISITNTEVSTFCIYCGNPSIVFSRVSKLKKPDMIIPFTVTKEQAMAKVRERIQKGFFIPDEIKNYQIEQMRGIYIPYHITNVEYDASMILSSVHKNNKSSTTYYYKRSAYAHMPWVTTDASTTLSDSSSQRLEPYHMKEAKVFDEDYLVGFYSDASDVMEEDAIALAKRRVKELYDAEMLKSITGSSKKILQHRERAEVYTKPLTAFLPAWFLTFRYKDEPYTIIINGQTGKIVGGVPWNKAKFTSMLISLSIVISLACIMALYFLLPIVFDGSSSRSSSDNNGNLIVAPIAAAIASISAGATKIKRVLKSISRTTASTLTSYVSKRQKGV
ncbi:MAG: hypothetical protein MJ108_01330 [Saccharofermentans sp.]|nr:hypothetical protein [Saccharofermentans sp.]